MSPTDPITIAPASTERWAGAEPLGDADPPARPTKSILDLSRPERMCLAALLAIFIAFTWRGLLMYYSGDDVMNMYWAWSWNHRALVLANFLPWVPLYRPLGESVYLAFYALFGFQPAPLYIFCWLLLIANVFVSFAFFRSLFSVPLEALTALALVLVHGSYMDLYSSAGTIYDRLCFFFVCLGMVAYARTRSGGTNISLARGALLWLLCLLAMDSKESGVTLLALFAAYECTFVLPSAWSGKFVGKWLRAILPFYLILTATSFAFIFGRVLRTPEMVAASPYHVRASAAFWLQNIAGYFDQLIYRHHFFSAATAAAVLLAMAAAAILLRNRIMLFGWLWFAIAITPVALITMRPGYVLYVPMLGFGLYAGALIAAIVRSLSARFHVRATAIAYPVFAMIVIATAWFHAAHWPGFADLKSSAVLGLADQFRQEYPALKRGSKLLFVSDYFGDDNWDMTFTLRLLNHDRGLDVRRVNAMPDQQPQAGSEFDHVFATAAGRYEELDNRDPEESIRLHILRNYSVGPATSFGHLDHSAYVVSGVMDHAGSAEGRWTAPHAKLKFQVYPAAAVLALHYWVPEFVAAAPAKTLTALVNGSVVGSAPLTKEGDVELKFPVKPAEISHSGYTIVDLVVDNPYKDAGGVKYGIILFNAGFEYRPLP